MPEDTQLTPNESVALAAYRGSQAGGDLRSGVQKLSNLLVSIVEDPNSGVDWDDVFEAFARCYPTFSFGGLYWGPAAILCRVLRFPGFAVFSLVGFVLAGNWFAKVASTVLKTMLRAFGLILPNGSALLALADAFPLIATLFNELIPSPLRGILFAAGLASKVEGGGVVGPGFPGPSNPVSPEVKKNGFFKRSSNVIMGRVANLATAGLDGDSPDFLTDVPFYQDSEITVTDQPDTVGADTFAPSTNPARATAAADGLVVEGFKNVVPYDEVSLAQTSDGNFILAGKRGDDYYAPTVADRLRDIRPGQLGVPTFA